MSKEKNPEKQMERKMGCMAGFLELFDLLPASRVVDTPLPMPVAVKNGGKLYRDSPRLSLDSRATMDAKGALHPKEIRTNDGFQQRSPSVVARLMGLDPPPAEMKPELRRSASESRASTHLFHSRFLTQGGINMLSKQPSRSHEESDQDPRDQSWTRKCLFDTGDIFPQRKQTVPVHGKIEKRLNIRGIFEASKDSETLKQILEALQLKGLLHSSGPNQASRRIFVYDDSPIVLIRPSRLPAPTSTPLKVGNHARSVRRHCSYTGEISPSLNPRLERYVSSPTTRNEGSASTRRQKSPVNPKPSSVGIQKRLNESMENRRIAPDQSPMRKPRRTRSDQPAFSGSKRSKNIAAKTKHRENVTTPIVVDDENSSVSGSSSSITTPTDSERSKTAAYREVKNLLERCTAEMDEIDTQPSPVSVLDSSLYKDASLTPSPVTTKRNLDFKDESFDLVEEIRSPLISPIRSKCGETSDDSDFLYISDILRASHCLSEESDVYLLVEKQQYLKGKDTSKVSRLQRKLIFDTATEILDRNRQLPPWKTASWDNRDIIKSSLNKVWSEFQRLREPASAHDMFGVICGVLKKDLSSGDATTSWEDCPVEKSEAVLDMERMIFKDLIGETIQDLAALACTSSSISSQPRRKLVF